MIEWERYLPEVMPSVAGCPEAIAITAIRNAAIDFCRRAPVWRENIEDIYPKSGFPEYDIDTPSQSQANIGELGSYEGKDFHPTTAAEVSAIKDILHSTGTPTHYDLLDPETIRLSPIPDDGAPTTAITIKMRLIPTRESHEAPDFLFNQYADIIAYGAKSRLHEMTGRPWYDRTSATDNKRLFLGAIAGVRGQIHRGRTNGQQRAIYKEFI